MAKWYVSAKKADFAAIGAKFGIDQVTARTDFFSAGLELPIGIFTTEFFEFAVE